MARDTKQPNSRAAAATRVVNMPAELKIPAAMLTPHRAAWAYVMCKGKQAAKGKGGGALSLYTGSNCMFTGATDSELQRIFSPAITAYEAEFTVSYQAAINRATFELANPDFAAAVRRAIEWATSN